MFLLFGTRGRWSMRRDDTGQFFCPTCGGDRTWVRAVLRRWFTLFFIPLFPLGKTVAEAVQCTTCQTRFEPSVLNQPTTSTLTAELQGSMRLAATAVVRAAGGGADAAIAAVRGAGMSAYDADAQGADERQLDISSLGDHLAYLAGVLTLPGREQFLGTLAQIAHDGSADAARPTLEQIGSGLGLTPAHVAGVIAGPRPASPPPPSSWPAPTSPPPRPDA